ncbi:SAM-dependent methyltransferase [Anaerobacillus arseniciselenatis]|uniref:SAM-dependent methyltransferase n=1 Tax=Anaerobacillus arseniciselenatis TaxID=85682 RepID=A0A1S2LUC8_9BACI|nr:tRNA (adenine(22)-N(1))-methyltransferase TrmK [Anaerobacillus arseniciselenatis]OIJ16131.1 SAM-dependent methyltransferase [Anaerobacillus arseniciselenatis]
MNETNLSKRLTLVAEQIPPGSTIADIGSDHAYLPCYALKHGLITSAIAGEVNEGPFQSAVEQVRKLNYTDEISVRKGNGLQVLNKGEVDVITIAGMGGPLIVSILEHGREKLPGIKRLILQPNVAANQIRVWLEENNWILINEEIIEEDGVIYEILTADREGNSPYSEEKRNLELLLGPFLMEKRSDIFLKKWKSELTSWKEIVQQFEKAKQTNEVVEKKKQLLEKINEVEEVLKWQN